MIRHFRTAFRDVLNGAQQRSLWLTLAWRDIRLRYVRTTIGPFWLTASTAIFTLAFALIYANLFNQEMASYLPYVTSGFLAWVLLSTIITESCTAFSIEKTWICNQQFPYSVIIYRIICRNIIVFFHNVVILVAIYVFTLHFPGWNILWIPVGLALIAINGLWIGLFLGTLCARFRDIQQLIASFLQIILFVTPIFWRPEMMNGSRMIFVNANVIYHVVTVLRAPLLGAAPPWRSVVITLAFAAVGHAFTFWFYGRFRRRIPFWI
jgi:homopolymeric O-antigen transport system permease protein